MKHAQFKLSVNVFMVVDGGLVHNFTFSEGVSLVVEFEGQDKIDCL